MLCYSSRQVVGDAHITLILPLQNVHDNVDRMGMFLARQIAPRGFESASGGQALVLALPAGGGPCAGVQQIQQLSALPALEEFLSVSR